MWLIRTAMRRPITILIGILGVALMSLLAVQRMKIDIFPDLGTPVIYVAQPYGGMDPAQMEGYIANYYEYHFLYVTGIEHVESRSIQGATLLKLFWESHDPTQGMRQGNDVGTQYRSGIYVNSEAERQEAEAARAAYEVALKARRYGPITTEILDAPPFYFAEDYHQQYLAKNPGGYCGLGGTGVSCPVGVGASA